MNNTVYELVRFSLVPGVSDADFLAASAALAPELRSLPGFETRALVKSADGRWMDIVRWACKADAEQAFAEITRRPACRPFLAMIDPATVDVVLPHPDVMQEHAASA